jgi:predicted amidophosphoribosyltransferase
MRLNSLKNIIFNNNCIICNDNKLSKAIPIICDKCLLCFEISLLDTCKVCGHPLNAFNNCPSCNKLGKIYFDSYNFIQYYTDFFKSLIYKLKIQEDFLINYLFFKLLMYKKIIKNDGIITAIPDTFIKKVKKGRIGLYYLLNLFLKHDYKISNNILKKNFIVNKSQKEKSVNERLKEIEKLYFLPRKNINKYTGNIYLIDDIYTTGATINYCSKLLKFAGFKKVHAVSFFRAKLGDY